MILDTLANSSYYFGLGPRFQRALEYLRQTDFTHIENGRHPIVGDEIVAMVARYQTKSREQGKWEAHRRYADIQFVVTGRERMMCSPLQQMTERETYDVARDCAFYEGEGQAFIVAAGDFVVFFPQDVHMPSLSVDGPQAITKVVMKVLI